MARLECLVHLVHSSGHADVQIRRGLASRRSFVSRTDLVYLRLTCLLFAGAIFAGCGSSASVPAPTRTAQTAFAHPPATVIDAGRSYMATVTTSDGTFSIKLLPKVAPIAVNNFVFLARHHYYDNMPIFRIYNRFMFQTGDPTEIGRAHV